MRHGILFFSLFVLLFAVAGGVFVLVNQGDKPAYEKEIGKDVFVASVSGGGLLEDLNGNSQADEKQAQKIEVNVQSVPKPAANQTAPSPVVSPAPQPEASTSGGSPPEADVPREHASRGDQPLAEAPEPTPSPSLADEESIPESIPAPQPLPSEPEQPQGKININTANLEELDQITGVGPSIAQNILDYRNSSGLFYYIEDIKNVSGIADAKFEKMKDEITVGNVAPPSPAPLPPPPPPAPTPIPPPPPSPAEPSPAKININTANYEELQEITGIGEVIAQRIIDYRNENGPFVQIEDIKNVKGIGEVTFEKMKDEIII